MVIKKLILQKVFIKVEIQVIRVIMRIVVIKFIIIDCSMVISFIEFQDLQIDLQMVIRVRFMGLFQITILFTKLNNKSKIIDTLSTHCEGGGLILLLRLSKETRSRLTK